MKKTVPTIVMVVLMFATTVMAYRWWIRPNEIRGAWTIVKQHGKDNYGYVTELGWGFVTAGYTNKASAEAAMKEARWHQRHPPKPQPKQSLWEPQ